MFRFFPHSVAAGLVLALAAVLAIAPTGAWAQAPAQALEAKTNKEGRVTVKVTPQAPSDAAAPLRFQVVLDTHSAALDQDMRASAVLVAGGTERAALAWEGDPPGGHHREGVLVFPPLGAGPRAVTLTIKDVGGVAERAFAWTLPAP
jgi:hypothetical protein